MSFIELFLIAVGLSMDAFAVAICAGLAMVKTSFRKALIVGLYFGVFQAVMPLAGYLAATLFADAITDFDHWIAFILLSLIGGRMIYGSFQKEGCSDRDCPSGLCEDRKCPGGKKPAGFASSLKPSVMFPLAIATSIDALAVGVSLAFLKASIIPAALGIGLTTLILSMVGVRIGSIFGTKFKFHAELAGGVILVLLGVKILLEHLSLLG